tara:strand:+ start:44012 stop:44332 length:321 start_codon:yes stop_codon:yes gene_type:complete
MNDFDDKTAVITGGVSGIGRALGELFLAKGMNVVRAVIEQNALDATVAALAAFGAIHIPCNNAGVFAGQLLWEESLADFQWQLNVNVWGVIHGIRTFAPPHQSITP